MACNTVPKNLAHRANKGITCLRLSGLLNQNSIPAGGISSVISVSGPVTVKRFDIRQQFSIADPNKCYESKKTKFTLVVTFSHTAARQYGALNI